MRRIAFGKTDFPVETLQNGDEIFQGERAYEFLLEVICGLHSPVKGETEVQGQFKTFFESQPRGWLKTLLKQAYDDAKVIRDAHLRGLGSQSYGSITRRKVRECSKIDIVGGGLLVREILPWLLKLDLDVTIYVRDPKKLADIAAKHDHVEIKSIQEKPKKLGALLIAAPMAAEDIRHWAASALLKTELIIDYRAESAADSIVEILTTEIPYLPLKHIFAEIDAVKGRVEQQVSKAQNHIREKVYAHQNSGSQE